jgi:hypothetical protein
MDNECFEGGRLYEDPQGNWHFVPLGHSRATWLSDCDRLRFLGDGVQRWQGATLNFDLTNPVGDYVPRGEVV